jgi:Alpha/beta hydrolase
MAWTRPDLVAGRAWVSSCHRVIVAAREVELSRQFVPLANTVSSDCLARDRLSASIVGQASDADSRFAAALADFGPATDGVPDAWDWNRATAAALDASQRLGFGPDAIPAPGTDPANAAVPGGTRWPPINSNTSACRPPPTPTPPTPTANAPPTFRPNSTPPTTAHQGRRLYLLSIDQQGDGKAIVAVGSPDTARHTAVLVPGVGTDLDHMGGQIDRATRISAAADTLHQGDVAVVTWLG